MNTHPNLRVGVHVNAHVNALKHKVVSAFTVRGSGFLDPAIKSRDDVDGRESVLPFILPS